MKKGDHNLALKRPNLEKRCIKRTTEFRSSLAKSGSLKPEVRKFEIAGPNLRIISHFPAGFCFLRSPHIYEAAASRKILASRAFQPYSFGRILALLGRAKFGGVLLRDGAGLLRGGEEV